MDVSYSPVKTPNSFLLQRSLKLAFIPDFHPQESNMAVTLWVDSPALYKSTATSPFSNSALHV